MRPVTRRTSLLVVLSLLLTLAPGGALALDGSAASERSTAGSGAQAGARSTAQVGARSSAQVGPRAAPARVGPRAAPARSTPARATPAGTTSRAAPARPAPQGTARRPDVVVVMLDDLAQLDDRIWQRMPTIRRVFLEQGVRLSNFHTESPLCCPGRAGYLTGQHTFNHGVSQNDVRLLDPRVTLATELDDRGYWTFLAGKYLNGYGRYQAPKVPPGWDRWHALSEGAYYRYKMWNNGNPVPEDRGSAPADYSTDVIRNKALLELGRAPKNRPFFAFLSPYAVHGPTTPARRHLNDPRCASVAPWRPANYNEPFVGDKPQHVQDAPLLPEAAYDLQATCETLLSVDEMIAAVRARLAQLGRLRDTMFVLAVDNGMNFGAHRLLGKQTPYATHIPAFVSWPGVLGTDGRRISERLQNIDLAPTICELAGCVMGPFPNGQRRADGLSFAKRLLGLQESLGRDAVIDDMPEANRVTPWYAVTTTHLSPLADVRCAVADEGRCRWQYVEYVTGEEELYDLSNGPCWTWQRGDSGDPCRLRNLAGDPDYAGLKDRLRDRLHELKSERGAGGGGG